MKPAKPRLSAGRPARISRADVAEAALAIGLDKVTLTEIGKKLGVDHSSLYRHVKGRDDVLLAASDLAIEKLEWEIETDDWRAYLEAAAEAVWDLYIRYPGLAGAIRSLAFTPPAGIRAFVTACQRLEEYGFSAEDAALVMDSVMDMTSDSSMTWQRLATSEDGNTIGEKLRQSWADQMPKDAAEARHIMLMQVVIAGNPQDWWQRKLALLLNGAAVLLAKPHRVADE